MEGAILKAQWIDYTIIVLYFSVTILVGFFLKKYIKTGEDFFLSGRSLPSWVTGLAFLAANLGALEVMGMVANSTKYGIHTVHFYWVGAIPAMLFIGLFMMPFYYGSRVRSVPEYLKYRYNEATRGLNAISFSIMTVFMSGINMYAMALIFKMLLGWSLTSSIFIAAFVVLIYVFLGGLSSSIYNEVLQFFLIWLGLLPVVFLGLKEVNGLQGLIQRLPEEFTRAWAPLSHTSTNPMGIHWLGMVLGLGFVLSFGYWTTDFLVVQRALSAENLNASKRTPVIASFPKMLMPILVVIPGLIAIAVLPQFDLNSSGEKPYNMALPLIMAKYLPNGVLGLGLIALLASFMSGMAGNVTAFNTVWTYDIYEAYIKKGAPDSHYVKMGRFATFFGVMISIGTAYIVLGFPNLMDYMQLIFSFFNAPLFATFLLGMFWKGATPWGGFFGLLIGILTAASHYILVKINLISYPSEMASNFWQAWWAWLMCFVLTILVSLFTPKKDPNELKGLVMGLSSKEHSIEKKWYKKPATLGIISFLFFIILNIIFW
ncbi:MAG: sodium:solute symporter family protein [Acidobacteriota bacterium]